MRSKVELEKRIALITGGSNGIGKAIAVALAREGADIILCALDSKSLREAQVEIEKLGVKVWSMAFDATDPTQVKKFFSDIIAKIGQLDILVNNVGGVRDHATFKELDDKQWIDSWKLNFMTMVYFTREALPLLEKSEHARIINISSSAGKQPGGFNPHYGAAKTAVNSLSKYLANQLAPQKILVNTITPSTVNGGLWHPHIEDKARRSGVSIAEATRLMEEEVIKKTPLGQVGTPEDVAELVAFLASDRAKFITGTCIAVDGGLIKSIF
ncbi:MAG: SDR family oxidoreductase [Candidatus Paceibacterota bacterium]|jgi:3-oxoacyl-[acyl-carrier protein] reductase